jgi:hypothetical protein
MTIQTSDCQLHIFDCPFCHFIQTIRAELVSDDLDPHECTACRQICLLAAGRVSGLVVLTPGKEI